MQRKSGAKGRLGKSHRNQSKGEPLSSVHGNKEQLERISRRLEERKSEKERDRLRSLAERPIASQIRDLLTFPAWFGAYSFYKVPNKKFDQIEALLSLQHEREEKWARFRDEFLWFDDLPDTKKEQYHKRLRMHSDQSPDFVRMYTCAEYAFEKWVKVKAHIEERECIDRNIKNLRDTQDYTIKGKDVDVKTTISFSQQLDGGGTNQKLLVTRSSRHNWRDYLRNQIGRAKRHTFQQTLYSRDFRPQIIRRAVSAPKSF